MAALLLFLVFSLPMFGLALTWAGAVERDPLRVEVGLGLIFSAIPLAAAPPIFMGPPRVLPAVDWHPALEGAGADRAPQATTFDLSPFANRNRSIRWMMWAIGVGLGAVVVLAAGTAPNFGIYGASVPGFLSWPSWSQWFTVVAGAGVFPAIFGTMATRLGRPGAYRVVVDGAGVSFVYVDRAPVRFPLGRGARPVTIDDLRGNAAGTYVQPGVYFTISSDDWEPLTGPALEAILSRADKAGMSITKVDRRDSGLGFRYIVSPRPA